MRYVNFDPTHLHAEAISEAEKEKFRLWLQKAGAATWKAVEYYEKNGKPSEEVENIWRAHKEWLLCNKFYHKCAYCEKSLSDIPKEAEHWRPKRKVSGPGVGDHPGYFWLAYNWRNLLPSCSMCNSYRGKKNQFPVSNGYVFRLKLADTDLDNLRCRADAIRSVIEAGCWYPGIEDLDALEGPLLLHPYVDEDLTQHLEFRPNGWIRPCSEKGEWSIKVFDLNREALRKARRKAERETANMVSLLLQFADNANMSPEEGLNSAEAISSQYITERTSYSAAKLAARARSIAQQKEYLD